MVGIDTAVDGGAGTREDLVGTADSAAWVLDGTSGFGERSFTPGPTDGRWYVEAMDRAFRERLHADASLTDVVAESIAAVARDLAEHVPDAADASLETAVKRHELPACTVSLVRWDDAELEYLVLCDATVAYATADGDAERVSTPGVLDRIDAETQRLRARTDSGDDDEPADVVTEQLRRTRAYANTPGGYWVAHQNPLAATFASTGRVAVAETDVVLLHSDGLDPLVAVDPAFDAWSDVLSFAATNGASATIDRLRDAEATVDAERPGSTRLGDDVGVVVIDP